MHDRTVNARPDDYAALRASVLFDIQQDWLGIYEVWWEANSRYPTRALSERLAIAEDLVSDLLGSGAVAIYRADQWPPSLDDLGCSGSAVLLAVE
jgi:hypothetical protein